MEIRSALNAIENVELALAKLYEWFSTHFASDPEASGFFFRMAMQERNHANIVAYSKTLARRTPLEFGPVDFDAGVVDDFLSKVDLFRELNPSPTILEAVEFSQVLEDHAAEGIHGSLICSSNPEIAPMIKSLAKADDQHKKDLEAFADRIKARPKRTRKKS